MNTDGTGFNTCKECHKTESFSNHTTKDHKEGAQLEDRRNVGESSCNTGDGTDQRVQVLDVYDDGDCKLAQTVTLLSFQGCPVRISVVTLTILTENIRGFREFF